MSGVSKHSNSPLFFSLLAGEIGRAVKKEIGVGSGGRTHDIQSHSLAFCH